jgi:uncharacterized DUF497 family protein
LKIEPDKSIEVWLNEEWDLSLDWDQGNIDKLTKHMTNMELVESIFDEKFIFGGRIVWKDETSLSENRYILYGKQRDGRGMALIWTIRKNQIRPISCRRLRQNELKILEGSI